MPFSWRNFPSPPVNGLASQSTSSSSQQLQLVCTWSAHVPQPGPSPLPFPRHRRTMTTTATAAGEFFLFGGYERSCASTDLYVFSTRDFSTTPVETNGKVPGPHYAHGIALIGSTLLICGGATRLRYQNLLNHDSLYLLDLVSQEWSHVVVKGHGPGDIFNHTTAVVGSKLLVFGGTIDRKTINDMWILDLNHLKSQPLWESYKPKHGNNKPPPRAGHVSITTEDLMIIFGGKSNQHYYNDTWSFDISTRKWTELQCTGSIPSPRGNHAAVLVDNVMYVFGGFCSKTSLDGLYALQLSTLRWFKLNNVGLSPHRRPYHAMSTYGTRVFVLGGDSSSLVYEFNTKHIKYPDPEPNAVNPIARRLYTGPSTQEQLENPKLSPSETSSTSSALGSSTSLQITPERSRDPNDRLLELKRLDGKLEPRHVAEEDVSEGSTEYKENLAEPHSSSEGENTISELEPQLSVLLAAQTEWDHRIAQLTDELAKKNALLEQAEANVAEATKRTGPEQREHAYERRQISSVEHRDVELVDMQAKLDELLLSHDQQIGQYEKELANVRAKLEAKESELEAVRLRLASAEKGWAKSKAEADASRTQTATGSANTDGGGVTRLTERVRVIEVQMASKWWGEKSIDDTEWTNE